MAQLLPALAEQEVNRMLRTPENAVIYGRRIAALRQELCEVLLAWRNASRSGSLDGMMELIHRRNGLIRQVMEASTCAPPP